MKTTKIIVAQLWWKKAHTHTHLMGIKQYGHGWHHHHLQHHFNRKYNNNNKRRGRIFGGKFQIKMDRLKWIQLTVYLYIYHTHT